MTITIECSSKEIAELVTMVQVRQKEKDFDAVKLQKEITQFVSDSLKATRDTFGEA